MHTAGTLRGIEERAKQPHRHPLPWPGVRRGRCLRRLNAIRRICRGSIGSTLHPVPRACGENGVAHWGA